MHYNKVKHIEQTMLKMKRERRDYFTLLPQTHWKQQKGIQEQEKRPYWWHEKDIPDLKPCSLPAITEAGTQRRKVLRAHMGCLATSAKNVFYKNWYHLNEK